MSRGLVETSFFVAREGPRPIETDRLPDELAVSVIAIGELRAGVLAASDVETRDRRLSTLITVLSISPLPVDEPVAEAWARIGVGLRDLNDSWIAATALAHAITS